ncbi:NPC intracellular cholesterol transporter 2-like [Argonauta hians]
MSSLCRLVLLMVLSLVALVPIVSAKSPYLPCGSPHGTVFDVRVGGCNGQGPCILRKNHNATVEVDFAPNVNVSGLTERIKGIIIGIRIPFPATQPNGCSGKGLECPLLQGRSYTYRNVMFVYDSYPSIRLVVEWAVVDENKVPVFCIQIPAKIQ